MDDISVRELRIFEIIKETVKLFRSAFWLCVPLCLLAFVPDNIIRLFIPQNVMNAELINDPYQLRFILIIGLVRLLFSCLVVGGYTYLAMSRYVGREVTLNSMVEFAINKWISVTMTGVLYFIILGVMLYISITALPIMVFPAIHLTVLFVFHRNIAAITGERGFKAFAASAGLVRGFFFKRMLYGAAFLFMYMFVMQVLGTIGIPSHGLAGLVMGVVFDILGSVFLLAQAVWFVNILLARKIIDITV